MSDEERAKKRKERRSEAARLEMEKRRAIIQQLLISGVYRLSELQEALARDYGIQISKPTLVSDRKVALSLLAAENMAVMGEYRVVWFVRLEKIARAMMAQLESGLPNDQRRASEVLLQVFAKLSETGGIEGTLTTELGATPELVEKLIELFKLLRERNVSPSEAFEAMINMLGQNGN